MQREIVLDTETTGLEPRAGHRLIEIGAIELVNRIPTGNEFHRYLNPERDVPPDAVAVHGLSTAFLADKPLFSAIISEFVAFIGDDPLVIHNAAFDVGFLNFELERLGRPAISMGRVVDTLALARRKHPGGPNSLDALCKRYGIDSSGRDKHGALIDSLLLAEVYVELLGERQATLGLATRSATLRQPGADRKGSETRQRLSPLPPRLTEEDERRHHAFVATLGSAPLWNKFMAPEPRMTEGRPELKKT